MQLNEVIELAKLQPMKEKYIPQDLVEDLDWSLASLVDVWSLDEEKIPFTIVQMVKWVCTDTHVGWDLIFMDDIPIAFAFLPYRKSSTDFDWIVTNEYDSRDLVYKWCIDNIKISVDNLKTVSDLNEEFDFDSAFEDIRKSDMIQNIFDGVLE